MCVYVCVYVSVCVCVYVYREEGWRVEGIEKGKDQTDKQDNFLMNYIQMIYCSICASSLLIEKVHVYF